LGYQLGSKKEKEKKHTKSQGGTLPNPDNDASLQARALPLITRIFDI
jgi:hypothetical protein